MPNGTTTLTTATEWEVHMANMEAAVRKKQDEDAARIAQLEQQVAALTAERDAAQAAVAPLVAKIDAAVTTLTA